MRETEGLASNHEASSLQTRNKSIDRPRELMLEPELSAEMNKRNQRSTRLLPGLKQRTTKNRSSLLAWQNKTVNDASSEQKMKVEPVPQDCLLR